MAGRHDCQRLIIVSLACSSVASCRIAFNAVVVIIVRLSRSHANRFYSAPFSRCSPEYLFAGAVNVHSYRPPIQFIWGQCSVLTPSTAPLRRVLPVYVDMTSRRRLRSSTSHRLEVPPVRLHSRQVGFSGCWVPPSGTTYLSTSRLPRHSRFSDNDLSDLPFLPRHL